LLNFESRFLIAIRNTILWQQVFSILLSGNNSWIQKEKPEQMGVAMGLVTGVTGWTTVCPLRVLRHS